MSPMDEQGVTLEQIAAWTGGVLTGARREPLLRVAPLDQADASALAPVSGRRYLGQVASSAAGALLVASEFEGAVADDPRPRVVVEDVAQALVPILEALHPAPAVRPGVHPTAVLGAGVELEDGVCVGPYVVLGEGVRVGAHSRIDAHCVIGDGARIGPDAHLHPHVVLYAGVEVGARVVLHSGVRLGVDGFGYAWTQQGHRKVPQVGRCIVADDVEIGANTCVDRGSIGDTVIAQGVKIDNLVHIAHNVQVGAHSAMAALVGVAGSTRIGRGVFFGGQAGVIGHLELGDGARIAAASKVLKSVPAGEMYSGHPARPNREHLRAQAHVQRLPRLLERIRDLEQEVAGLRERYIQDLDGDSSETSDPEGR